MKTKADPNKYALFDQATTPKTRTSHPGTSHRAAQLAKLSSRKVALEVLHALYHLRNEDKGIADESLQKRLSQFPDSSVRARRSDLVHMGLVIAADNYSTTKAGSKCKTWRITEAGIAWYQEHLESSS